jgi:hypothetical protein
VCGHVIILVERLGMERVGFGQREEGAKKKTKHRQKRRKKNGTKKKKKEPHTPQKKKKKLGLFEGGEGSAGERRCSGLPKSCSGPLRDRGSRRRRDSRKLAPENMGTRAAAPNLARVASPTQRVSPVMLAGGSRCIVREYRLGGAA